MKPSGYNYYVPHNNGVIFMNGISEAMFWINDNYAEIIKSIIAEPDSYVETYFPFLQKLLTSGFIIKNETNETDLIEKKYHLLRCEDEYRIMILPTYQCNLRCWYCVQEHAEEWLTSDHIKAIKNRIGKVKTNPEISR